MTINLFSKRSSSLAVAAVLAAGPVFAGKPGSEDERPHAPKPLAVFAGEGIVTAQPLTSDFFGIEEASPPTPKLLEVFAEEGIVSTTAFPNFNNAGTSGKAE